MWEKNRELASSPLLNKDIQNAYLPTINRHLPEPNLANILHPPFLLIDVHSNFLHGLLG